MRERQNEFDYDRYRQLLAEAVDEKRQMALINLLIDERAKDRLAAELASDRAAVTAMKIAEVVRTSPHGNSALHTSALHTSALQTPALRSSRF
jgi:hypothetical protein